MIDIKSSEITPEHIYLSRRKFMVGLGALAVSSLALSACGVQGGAAAATEENPPEFAALSDKKDELGDALTKYPAVTNFNNYYEFTTDKEEVAGLARGFKTSPWEIDVGGLVNNPGTYDIEDLRQKFTRQERIYRLRCVEGWSMVIPWQGFPLAELLKEVEPINGYC